MFWWDFNVENHSRFCCSHILIYFWGVGGIRNISHSFYQYIRHSQRKVTEPLQFQLNQISGIMDPTIQAETERLQSNILEKLSTVFDNSVKRQLEDSRVKVTSRK